jgi:copper homeostasis protein (lipoprotein)
MNAGAKVIKPDFQTSNIQIMKKVSGIIAMVIVMAGCGESGEKENNAVVVPHPDTPQVSAVEYMPVIVGGYSGVVPCADCDGVDTRLTMFADTTYELAVNYIGKNPKDTAGLNKTTRGRYMLHNDTVQLIETDSKFLKTDTALFQLDKTGKFMTGKKKEKYVLKKVSL